MCNNLSLDQQEVQVLGNLSGRKMALKIWIAVLLGRRKQLVPHGMQPASSGAPRTIWTMSHLVFQLCLVLQSQLSHLEGVCWTTTTLAHEPFRDLLSVAGPEATATSTRLAITPLMTATLALPEM